MSSHAQPRPVVPIPALDDPPPGTLCPHCGAQLVLWKPAACYEPGCGYREPWPGYWPGNEGGES